ncbi:hypothetical protein [Vagococcus fluvialis]|uniref:hypothetical protein n=2 Tax=Bacilli TaxID=91061 RepID=UPI003B595D50
MRDRKIQKISFILTSICILIIITACHIPTLEEQELKKEEEKQAEIEKIMANRTGNEKFRYRTTAKEVFDKNGIEAPLIDDTKELRTGDATLNSGDEILVVFEIQKWTDDSYDYEKINQKDIDEMNFDDILFKTNRVDFTLSNPTNIILNEKDSSISLNLTVTFNENPSYLRPERGFGIEMKNLINKPVRSSKLNSFYFNIGIGSPIDKTSLSTPTESETYQEEEDSVIPINDGNIDDWDHILDDWELEEGIAEDGEGIYD